MSQSGSIDISGGQANNSGQGNSGQGDYSYGATRYGYAPGQVGYIPPNVSQWTFQNAQYEQMYAKQDRYVFGHRPILMATAWSFPLAFLALGVMKMAIVLTPEYANLSNFDWLFLIIIWAVAFYVVLVLPLRLWLGALALHRRNKGNSTKFSRKLAWIDPLLHDPKNAKMLARDYPTDTRTSRDFYPYV